jgi:hypothetical protein
MVYAQFAEAGKRLSRAVYVLEKSVINTIWPLLLPIFNWPNIMICPGSLLLAVPTCLQFQFYGWGCKKVNK